ncbi:MAG: response regulator transcription factor [Bacillota bacterium]|nr:response regulator transcription factor [Bacillota bacterium]MDI7249264.1 response regulator transcription factor [Bacillota bacterium]
MVKAKVLVVEDEAVLLSTLKFNLEKEGYAVATARDGWEALEVARAEKPDLVILDVMLPELDGIEVCRHLRRESAVPVVMLTARGEEIDRVVGLEVGADDYVTKPFSMRELMARVRAVLRRVALDREAAAASTRDTQVVEAGPVSIDAGARRVRVRGENVELRPKEFDLLWLLVQNRGMVLSRDLILEKVWGYDFPGDMRTVDVHIRWLREKIEENPGQPRWITTVRGLGYRFEPG